MAKKFFHVSAGMFLLSLSYQLGAQSAGAQSGSMVTGYVVDGGEHYVLTANGDVYRNDTAGGTNTVFRGAAVSLGNFWNGVTPAQSATWGQVKSTYRK